MIFIICIICYLFASLLVSLFVIIMTASLRAEEIAKIFFRISEGQDEKTTAEQTWRCRECGKDITRLKSRGGWTMLTQHVKTHKDWEKTCQAAQVSGQMYNYVTRTVSPRAVNAFNWIEWIVMDDLPFSFIEKRLTRKNTSLEPLSRSSLMKYLGALSIRMESKIKEMLPDTFGGGRRRGARRR